MSATPAMQLPVRGSRDGLLTSWSLVSKQAVLLATRSGGTLQVDKGVVWLTLDGPHQGPANDWGDRFLACGTRIHVTAGQQVVLERMVPAANEPVCFSWEPDAPVPPAALRRLRAALGRAVQALRTLARASASGRDDAPAVPRDPDAGLAQAKEQAWRSLYHLRSNQP